MKKQTIERFTDRVSNYIKYRPDYPPQVLRYLAEKTGLAGIETIADIGSGTGIFTKHLLDVGYKVFAVEPNEAMRLAADEWFDNYPNYTSLNATATATTLKDHSVDFIVCAQAFHWFNNKETQAEFQRILKPDGYISLIWNNRLVAADQFSVDYDNLLKNLSNDYNEVNHQKLTETDFKAFYRNGEYEFTTFPNEQVFDEAGLIGRAQSSSYVPMMDTPKGQIFYDAIKAIFKTHQQNGKVKFLYQTEVYLGKV